MQVTKPIMYIVVKIPFKLLYVYVIQVVKKLYPWPQLISKFLVTHIAASDWPHTLQGIFV